MSWSDGCTGRSISFLHSFWHMYMDPEESSSVVKQKPSPSTGANRTAGLSVVACGALSQSGSFPWHQKGSRILPLNRRPEYHLREPRLRPSQEERNSQYQEMPASPAFLFVDMNLWNSPQFWPFPQTGPVLWQYPKDTWVPQCFLFQVACNQPR